ncbi:cation:proton antiporter [Microbacterium sp. ZXX196]|uniref:cation:proton antiporter domain-containing protein n=1 Tax=Microbacterium sp. ZXX196 TaxID=2609291 RepID=UPI0012B7EA23|nr:cation:proton antiporter [Microbacterium sp. ZXX196]MTE24428.1 potassium transporter Kef [Microbacterium sp. ZXX196]
MFTTTAAIHLAVAFALGLGAVLVRLPPLVGFLAAGFVLGAAGVEDLPLVSEAADLGVTLLLFGIGLKLDVRTLVRKEVWLTNGAHMLVSTALGAGLLGLASTLGMSLLDGTNAVTWALIGFGLSFSSTVFVVKVLDDRSDITATYGRIAVGVLVMQDIAAVAFLTIAGGDVPSPWAFALVGLVPLAWVFRRVWDLIDAPDLQVLYGIVLALVPGYALFEAVGLKGDLGALIVGALLAGHPVASDVAHRLLSVKELLLVAFFLDIGLSGVPTGADLAMAGVLLVLLPVQTVAYVLLLWAMRLRHRTSWLTALTMANFSEFGLIIAVTGAASGLVPERWVTVMAVAVAASFVLSAIVNARGVRIAERLAALMPAQDPARLHPEDRPLDVGHASALVLGMGRVGRAAFTRLRDEHGIAALGIEHDATRVEALRADGLDVLLADATDSDFWARVSRSDRIEIAILAMPFHTSNMEALDMLRASGFTGRVAALARYDRDAAELAERGANAVFHLYGSAGTALADETIADRDGL